MQDNIDVFFTLIADKLKQLRMDNSDADWSAMSEALDTSEFDTALQAKLANLVSSPAPEADWNALEHQLNDLDFDAALHARLTTATIPVVADDWDAFESDLDDLSIDTVFREKLAAASVPVAEGDWDVFEAELDELSFDAVLRDKLEAADIPAEETGWALLASQLGADFDRAMASKLGGATVAGESEWPVMEDQLEAPTEMLLVEKINSYSHPYDKKAWRKFLPMLNAAMPRSNFPWRSMAAAAILLLLAGSAALFIMKGNLFDVSQEPGFGGQEPGNAPIAETQVPASENSQESGVRDREEQAYNREKVIDEPTEQTASGQMAVQDISGKPEATIESHKIKKVHLSDILNPGVKEEQNKTSPKEKVVVLPGDRTSIASDKSGLENGVNASQSEFEVFNAKSDTGYVLPKVDVDVPAPDLAAALNPLKTIYFDRKSREKSFSGNLQIGWTHALLNSSTRLSDPGSPGYLSGIQLNVPISQKLQLITGLLYGQKSVSREVSNVADRPSIGSSTRTGEPEIWNSLLDADFAIVEIPVMLRYPLTPADQKLSLALQGGFSGLLIVNAQYRHYDPESPLNVGAPDDTPLRGLKAEEEMQRGGASWGNFRFAPVIGYRLSNRVVFEAAPFLQFGQQRLGNKQLKLHSAGGTASILIELGKKLSN